MSDPTLQPNAAAKKNKPGTYYVKKMRWARHTTGFNKKY